jgi:hypothetical protein
MPNRSAPNAANTGLSLNLLRIRKTRNVHNKCNSRFVRWKIPGLSPAVLYSMEKESKERGT